MPASGIAPLVVPFGENASLGVVKETVFQTFPGAPTIFHAIESFSSNPTWKLIDRPGARRRRGQSLPIKGGFVGKASLTPENDGDTVGQLLAFGMGGQTTPALATFVNTTTSGSIAILTPATITPVGGCAGIIAGQTLNLDTAGNLEAITVIAVNYAAGTFTANTTKTHLTGVPLVGTGATAKSSALTLGQLPSFSMELNRVTDAVDYVGCKINGFTLGIDKQKGLTSKFDIVYANEIIQGAPTSPSFSTKVPFSFEHPNNFATIFGALVGLAGGVTVHSFEVQVANNLFLDYYSLGSGPNVVDFPETLRKVTGKAQLGFETDLAYQKFLGASGTTSINTNSVAFDMRFCTTDVIEPANSINYGLEIILGNTILETHGTPITSNGIIYQDITFRAAETVNQGNDDVKIVLFNTASAIY